jgi:hypothetical protein
VPWYLNQPLRDGLRDHPILCSNPWRLSHRAMSNFIGAMDRKHTLRPASHLTPPRFLVLLISAAVCEPRAKSLLPPAPAGRDPARVTSTR